MTVAAAPECSTLAFSRPRRRCRARAARLAPPPERGARRRAAARHWACNARARRWLDLELRPLLVLSFRLQMCMRLNGYIHFSAKGERHVVRPPLRPTGWGHRPNCQVASQAAHISDGERCVGTTNCRIEQCELTGPWRRRTVRAYDMHLLLRAARRACPSPERQLVPTHARKHRARQSTGAACSPDQNDLRAHYRVACLSLRGSEYNDLVGVFDRVQPVCNDDRRASVLHIV